MEARPPALIEKIVGALIPTASREDVLGDLQERCTTTPRYLGAALGVVPFVIFSHVRRSFDALKVAVQANVIFLVLRPRSIGTGAASALLMMFAPLVIALLALIVFDAFEAEIHAEHADDAFHAALKRCSRSRMAEQFSWTRLAISTWRYR